MMEKNLASKLNISLLTLCVLTLLLAGVTFAGTKVVGTLAKTIREDNTRSKIQVERPGKISSLKESYTKSKADILRLEAAYPANDFEALLPFTSDMSALAAHVGVTATTNIISEQPVVSPKGGSYILFRVQMRTTYPTFDRYLGELEKLPYFIEIESVSITDPVNINGVSDAKIDARLFVRSEALK